MATTVTKHFYGAGLQVAKMVNSTAYYLHQDALGSTRLETTSTVTVTFSSNYVPYGNNYAMSGKEVFMYTGKPLDSATGLYYYGARYYDEGIGRFVTEDSYTGNRNDPMTLNLYVYARDNPERYNDLTGHMYNGRMWTDFNDPYVVQTSSCVNGVCTTTTTESYGGYTSTISTAYGTTTTLSGTQITGMATEMTDMYPTRPGSGSITTVTTTSSSVVTVTPGGRSSTTDFPPHTSSSASPDFTIHWNWDAAGAITVMIGGVFITAGAIATGDVPLAVGASTGTLDVGMYLNGSPDPSAKIAFEKMTWDIAFAFGVGYTRTFLPGF